MKNVVLTLIITICSWQCQILNAQHSFSTSFAFRLFDENREIVAKDKLIKEYDLLNVFGHRIDVENDLYSEIIWYDEKTQYYTIDITSIGPLYCFTIHKDQKLMTIYIPFTPKRSDEHTYAVENLSFREGDYLMDFSSKNREKIKLNTSFDFLVIDNVDWETQAQKFLNSEYNTSEIYRKSDKN